MPVLAGADKSPGPSAADIAAAISRAPAKFINWVTFTGGGGSTNRDGANLKGPDLDTDFPGASHRQEEVLGRVMEESTAPQLALHS